MGNANNAQVVLENKRKIEELTANFEAKLKKSSDKIDKVQEQLDKIKAKSADQENEINELNQQVKELQKEKATVAKQLEKFSEAAGEAA